MDVNQFVSEQRNRLISEGILPERVQTLLEAAVVAAQQETVDHAKSLIGASVSADLAPRCGQLVMLMRKAVELQPKGKRGKSSGPGATLPEIEAAIRQSA